MVFLVAQGTNKEQITLSSVPVFTLTQISTVTKKMEMERKRKNMRNQALQCNQLLRTIMRMYSCKTHGCSQALLHQTASESMIMHVFLYLEFPLLLLHHGADDIQGRVGEAEHEQQRQLVLDGQDEDVVDEGRVREAGQRNLGSLEEGRRRRAVVGLHDGSIHRVLHLQEALAVISCPRETYTVFIRFTQSNL